MKLLTIIALVMAGLFSIGKLNAKYLLVEVEGGSKGWNKFSNIII